MSITAGVEVMAVFSVVCSPTVGSVAQCGYSICIPDAGSGALEMALMNGRPQSTMPMISAKWAGMTMLGTLVVITLASAAWMVALACPIGISPRFAAAIRVAMPLRPSEPAAMVEPRGPGAPCMIETGVGVGGMPAGV